MTSASIMEMQKTGFAMQTNAAKAAPVNPGVQFSDAMEFASAEQQQNESAEPVCNSEVKTHAEKSAAQHTGRKEIKESQPVEAKEGVADEQISEEVEAKEEEIVKEIAEKLGVSEEEVRNAMEVLGLSLADLLSQGNMATLTAQLTGMQTVDVLTDEVLFAQVTELTQNVQNILESVADELGMTLEQLQAAIDEQLALNGEVQMAQEEPEVQQEAALKEDAEVIRQAETVAVDEVAEPESKQVKSSSDTNVMNSSEETETEQEVRDTKIVAETGSEQKAGAQEHSGQKEEHSAAFMQESQVVQATNNNVNQVNQMSSDKLFEGQFDLEQTREMIHQISDYVRVHYSEKVSSMEIQLHPAELGTVNLQVVAKDGNISARLAVQDEAVRAALESQVVQVRESLQAQGLKIDAVEVTVATHEFEQNLDQHGKDAEEQAAKEKKGGRKILDLNEIGQGEEEDAEMSDADRLQIEMMRMGGNRLNFRV